MSSFKWSTPGRRLGKRSLPLIPNEVYLEIFDYVEPSEEMSTSEYKRLMSNLALVCRFFCAVALPRIFKSLEFAGQPHKGTVAPGYAAFCRLLNKNEEPARTLALHIQECTFRDWYTSDDHLSWAFRGFLGLYTQATTRMANLGSLCLSSIPIGKEFLHAIGKIKSLHSLSIKYCLVEDGATVRDIRKLGSLELSTFVLHGQFLHSDTLAEVISTPALRVLRTTNSHFANVVMEQAIDFQIEEIEISYVTDMRILRVFLGRVATITHLKIDKMECLRGKGSSSTGLRLTPSSLPRLHTIRCPPPLLSDFVPSRPIQSVDLSGAQGPQSGCNVFHYSLPQMTIKDALVLKTSTAEIRELDIPSHFFLSTPFHEYFPHLEILSLNFVHTNYSNDNLEDTADRAVQTLSEKWPPLLSIRELKLYLDEDLLNLLDLEFQHRMILSYLVDAFPRVVRIRFTDCVEWRRNTPAGSWRVFVPHCHRNDVQAALRDLVGFKDFNGCFAGLFHSVDILGDS